MCCDILELDISTLPKTDLIIGSPPCQDFSYANIKRKQNPILINKFIEIIETLKPRFWIMEEVQSARAFVPKLWIAKILSASNYGAEHQRKRLFAGNFKLPFAKIRRPTKPTPLAGWQKIAFNKPGKHKSNLQYVKTFGNKKPTIEMMYSLMGLRSDYILCGNDRDKKVQCGNGVYVPLAQELGKMLI